MTTCGYAHAVLSGFLSSNGVIVLILLKLELFIPSSAITYIWVTLRPPVGRLDFFMLIGRKIRISSADSSSYNENKLYQPTSFFNRPTNTRLSADRRPTVCRLINYNMALASVSMRVLHTVAKLTASRYLFVFRQKKKTLSLQAPRIKMHLKMSSAEVV